MSVADPLPRPVQRTLLRSLSVLLASGRPVHLALPEAFFDAGVHPRCAVRRLAHEPHWSLPFLLDGLVDRVLLETVRHGEESGHLVSALEEAWQSISLIMPDGPEEW